jgi:hypothetical protein
MGEKKEREMREGDRMERIEMWKNGGIFRLDEGNEGRIRRKKFQMVKGEGEIGHLKSSLKSIKISESGFHIYSGLFI